jgi:hypothetical protein
MTNSSGVRPSVIDAANRAGGWPVTTRRDADRSALVRESLSRFQGSRCFGPCRRPRQIRRGAYRVWPQSVVARRSRGRPNAGEMLDLVHQAIAAGELPPETDADLLIDTLTDHCISGESLDMRRWLTHSRVSSPHESSRRSDRRLASDRATLSRSDARQHVPFVERLETIVSRALGKPSCCPLHRCVRKNIEMYGVSESANCVRTVSHTPRNPGSTP